jgi:hypothetical protein
LQLADEAGERELVIFESTSDESVATLQLRDTTTIRYHDGRTHQRVVDHSLEPGEDAVLPLYALSNPTKVDDYCKIKILYNRGRNPVNYHFQSRQALLEFQQIVTGYQTVATFSSLPCSIIHRHNRRSFGKRDKRSDVIAEVQFWQPISKNSPNRRAPSIRTTSARSIQASIASEASETLTFQSDPITRKEIVVSFTSPPVLVFLGTGGPKHILLKVDSMLLFNAVSWSRS